MRERVSEWDMRSVHRGGLESERIPGRLVVGGDGVRSLLGRLLLRLKPSRRWWHTVRFGEPTAF